MEKNESCLMRHETNREELCCWFREDLMKELLRSAENINANCSNGLEI